MGPEEGTRNSAKKCVSETAVAVPGLVDSRSQTPLEQSKSLFKATTKVVGSHTALLMHSKIIDGYLASCPMLLEGKGISRFPGENGRSSRALWVSPGVPAAWPIHLGPIPLML